MPRRATRSLLFALVVTDALFIAYWIVAALAEVNVVSLPPSLMYAGYGDDRVCAWNWSFFPLDVAFSVTGLLAARWARREDPRWRPMALVSLTLTVVAGLMAVSYWTLLGQIDLAWFLPNLALVVWPMPYLVWLVRDMARPARVEATA
jgi:hypothetical protein